MKFTYIYINNNIKEITTININKNNNITKQTRIELDNNNIKNK